jgi:D-3-phosphoglycerate dehydrogenase
MNIKDSVAVCSRSFSKNLTLRSELLALYKNVEFNDCGAQLNGAELISFLSGHTKAIVALEDITADVLQKLPKLGVISKYGVGLDSIDLAAMKLFNKQLGWTGGVNRRSVSELVISFAINMLRHISESHQEVCSGVWRQHIGGLLSDRTVGIIGCGHVGKDLVELLKPFRCEILVFDIVEYREFYLQHQIKAVSLDDLLRLSDVISLHIPYNSTTRLLLDSHNLSKIKKSAVLINTARGGLVDELALKEMLLSGRIAAAAFDVFSIEPPKDLELLNLPNFLATPHIGGSAEEAILAMGRSAIDGLDNHKIPTSDFIAQNR